MSWFSKIFTSSKPGTIPAAAGQVTDDDRDDIRILVHNLVWGGFDTRAEIRQAAEESLPSGAWSKDDLAWLDGEIDRAVDDKRRAERAWSGPSAYDKLDAVFTSLKAKGIMALHRAGNTQSDGWDDARQYRDEAGGAASGIEGAVFYHGQDVDRVLEDQVLLLTFGTFPQSRRSDMEIAAQVVAALKAAGFDAVAPADASQRIEIRNIAWSKRSP